MWRVPPGPFYIESLGVSQVAFLMNCGIQGVDADPSTLQDIYPQGPPAAIEQRVSYERAPLTYGGVQQKLYMEDLDARQELRAQPLG